MARLSVTLQIWKNNQASAKSIQGEAASRTIEVTFLDSSGQPIDLTGCTPRMYVDNHQPTPPFNNGTIVDATGGIADFPITSDMLAVPGEWPCEFLLTGENYAPLKANGLILRIDASNLESAEEGANNYSALVVALNSIKQSVTDAAAAVENCNNATSAANTAEATRQADETARQSDESARQSQETTRQTDEGTRNTAETARANAETERQSQEQSRKGAETARSAAETARAGNESTRQTNETNRQNAESTRVSDEDARKTNEADRQSQETTRQDAETARASAESNRVTAEQGRADAESARVDAENQRQSDTATAINNANAAADMANHVPQYGESGNWESWNGTAYADSGKPWKGEKGDPFEYGQSYDTLADLQAAYPSGDAKGHLVGEVAYVWDGSAWKPTSVDLSAYQKTADADAKYVPLSEKNVSGGVMGYDAAHAHIVDADIHVTAAQKEAWTGKADHSTVTTATLSTSDWTGSDAPYSQTIDVTGALPEPVRIEVQPSSNATAEQWEAWRSALIRGGGQDMGTITLLADGDKPEINIPIIVTVRGDVS